jgi:hypothetical protein
LARSSFSNSESRVPSREHRGLEWGGDGSNLDDANLDDDHGANPHRRLSATSSPTAAPSISSAPTFDICDVDACDADCGSCDQIIENDGACLADCVGEEFYEREQYWVSQCCGYTTSSSSPVAKLESGRTPRRLSATSSPTAAPSSDTCWDDCITCGDMKTSGGICLADCTTDEYDYIVSFCCSQADDAYRFTAVPVPAPSSPPSMVSTSAAPTELVYSSRGSLLR